MSFDQAAGTSPGASLGAANSGLEVQLRGMMLASHQTESSHEYAPAQRLGPSGPSHQIQSHQQGQAVPFLGISGNMGGSVTDFNHFPHSTSASQPSSLLPMLPMDSNFPPVTQGLPSSGSFSQGGSFASVPASPVSYRTYTGLSPGLQVTGLPPQPSLPQSPNMSPNTPPHQEYVPPHMRSIYGQQPSSPQHDLSPPRQRQQPPQMAPRRGRRSQNFLLNSNNHQGISGALPPSALDQFPPSGTQPAKVKLQNPYQQPIAQNSQQRIQYQPLPVNTHNFSPLARGSGVVRGNFRAASYAGRPPQQYVEQVSAEQSYHLNEFSKRIAAEAAPPEIETSVKHALLKRLEAICKEVSPDAKLIPFGSLVTGFATANSDLDVIFTLDSQSDESLEDLSSPHFRIPLLLESKLQDEGFDATLLTKTRVPILKLVQNPTAESPFELHCDIGFSNHLAVFNTNMLSTYSRCDSRLKQMIMFIKWWAKKRHINNPYRGTLSSYGYSLIVLHYLINIVKPPVLPNLQTFPIPDDTPTAEIVFEGATGGDEIFEIWFYKAIDTLPKSSNAMHVGELLKGFFEYYAHAFQWGREVVSIRTKGGLLTKQGKGWVAAVVRPGKVQNSEVKDRYLFAVEDPFEVEHNVSRTCNGPGVGRIREEFRRAVRLIRFRDGGKTMSECLCMEAPPERPWIRREDRDRLGQGKRGDGSSGGGGGGGEGDVHVGEEKRGEEGTQKGNSEEAKRDPDAGRYQEESLGYEGPVDLEPGGVLLEAPNTL